MSKGCLKEDIDAIADAYNHLYFHFYFDNKGIYDKLKYSLDYLKFTIEELKTNNMSYNKMSNTELISVIVEKEYQVKDLTEKNERLEAAQLAFDAELEKEFKKMEAMNGWQRFIKGFSIGIQIYQTYMKARQEYFERPKNDSNSDLSKHLID